MANMAGSRKSTEMEGEKTADPKDKSLENGSGVQQIILPRNNKEYHHVV